jgi:hypothetical protein
MNNKLRLKRLKQLKYMMENHKKIFPESIFDIDAWIKPAKSRCGTAACALGSACFYPPFQKQGLSIDGYKKLSDVGKAAKKIGEDAFDFSPGFDGNDYDGYETGANFFGIEIDESYFLFKPDHYKNCGDDGSKTFLHRFFGIKQVEKVTPAMVAQRTGMIIERYKNHKD